MKAVILVGKNNPSLDPLRSSGPDCGISLYGDTLLGHQIRMMRAAGVEPVGVVDESQCEGHSFPIPVSRKLEPFLKDRTNGPIEDLLLCDGDILYDSTVVRALLQSYYPLSAALSFSWELMDHLCHRRSSERGDGFCLDDRLCLRSSPLDARRGRFTGMVRVRGEGVGWLLEYLGTLSADADTVLLSFLHHTLERNLPVRGVPVRKGWLRLEGLRDWEVYQGSAFAASGLFPHTERWCLEAD